MSLQTQSQPNNLSLEFSPPVEITNEEFTGLLGLDFTDKDKDKDKEEKPEVKETKKINLKPDETKIEIDNEEDGEGEGEGEDKPNLSINPKEDDKKNEEASIIDGEGYISIINALADEMGFDEVPEGFDTNTVPDKELFLKFIAHNTSKKIDDSIGEFFDNLNETTKRLISYDLNSKGEGIESYVKSLIEENSIKSLDVENEFDQEKIVRKYYENTGDFSKDEIEEKIKDFKDASLLEKEAKKLKPKLDQIAEKIAKEQEETQEQLRQFEKQMSENYNERVINLLKDGNVGGIKLTKDEVTSIYSFLTDDKIDITLPNGKKTKMPPLEAIIYYNKYDKKGSIENLALATLLLTNPKKFDDVYAKRATTKITEEFVRDNKYSNRLKIGGGQTVEKPQVKKTSAVKNEETKYRPWNLKD